MGGDREAAVDSGRSVDAIVIGASAGGPAALKALLSHLDPALAAAVVIVNHIGPQGPDLLGMILASASPLPVALAVERAAVATGTVHIAPSGYHLLIERERRFSLSVDEKVCFSRPSIDVLFQSAARAYGSRLAGVILTGASRDGAQGLKEIRDRGGIALVQAPEEAMVSTMPQAALELAGADLTASVTALAARINRLTCPDLTCPVLTRPELKRP